MTSLRITYSSRNDTSAEVEVAALANIYRLVLGSANKNAAGATNTNGRGTRAHE
jgi:hypothetical protein